MLLLLVKKFFYHLFQIKLNLVLQHQIVYKDAQCTGLVSLVDFNKILQNLDQKDEKSNVKGMNITTSKLKEYHTIGHPYMRDCCIYLTNLVLGLTLANLMSHLMMYTQESSRHT